MQLTVTMQHRTPAPAWGAPVYVRKVEFRGPRPYIHTQPEPVDVQDETTVDALDAILDLIVSQRGGAFCGYRIETSDHFARVVEH